MVAPTPARRPKPLSLKPNVPYFCSINFLLKILEFVLPLLSLIFALSFDGNGAIVCIEILSTLALVTALSWCILYSINMSESFPEFFPALMLGYHTLMTVCMIAVTACAAYLWPSFKMSIYPQYTICTLTSAVAALLFLIDTILTLMWWRGASGEFYVYPWYSHDPHVVH
ncbi:uncharacterized protein [Watersipora subatra]|uniref:uncharacterized protein n=1 Tax=Watersipora subatra TaxID=2589382 RepID=UPI00355C6B8B